jgi:hypothetical protein
VALETPPGPAFCSHGHPQTAENCRVRLVLSCVCRVCEAGRAAESRRRRRG